MTRKARSKAAAPAAGVFAHETATRRKQPTSEMREQAAHVEATEQRSPFSVDRTVVRDPVLAWEREGVTSRYADNGDPEPSYFASRMLHTREKVHPLALREQLAKSSSEPITSSLFEDFNHLPDDAKPWDFYEHDHRWQNRLIHGDSAQVMRTLIDRDGLRGQVQCVYFDPPYGIKFSSNFAADANQTETGRGSTAVPVGDLAPVTAFKDSYDRGLHSFFDGIHERLVLLRELLADTGSVFVQIGDDNVHRMAIVLDEIFGSGNRLATITWKPTNVSSASGMPQAASYLLWYAKDHERATQHHVYEPVSGRAEIASHFTSYAAAAELVDGTCRRLTVAEMSDPDEALPDGARVFKAMVLSSMGYSEGGRSAPYLWSRELGGDGRVHYLCGCAPTDVGEDTHSTASLVGCPKGCRPARHWRVSTPAAQRHANATPHDTPDWQIDCGLNELARQDRLFTFSDKGSLCWKQYEDELPGRKVDNVWHQASAPSGKRYPVQTSDKIVQRCILMASDPGDLVLDPTCGSGVTLDMAEKWGRRWVGIDVGLVSIAVVRRHMATRVYDWYRTKDDGHDPSAGLVCETIPRVSAATLAYGTVDAPENQIVINDRPEKVPGKVRLCGPFTVESWSPYKVIGFEDYPGEPDAQTVAEAVDDQTLDDALTEGGWLHSTEGERLLRVVSVDRVDGRFVTRRAECETGAGKQVTAYIAAAGMDTSVTSRFAAFACNEMLQIDPSATRLLLISAAFDPDIPSEMNKITVTKVARSRSSALAGLSKHNDSANDFVILAEPTVSVLRCGGDNAGKICLRIDGYDTYNPETGQLAPGEASEVVCWMADTDHNGAEFFSRLTHFPGRLEQVKHIAASLKRELDEDAMSHVDTLTSQPFEPPAPDADNPWRIAVKIITTAGVEMNTRITSDEISAAVEQRQHLA